MRSGSACRKSGANNPSSIPIRPKRSPTAPSEKAAGYPSSRNITSEKNMIGAMFWMMKSVIRSSGRWRRSALFDGVDEMIDFGFKRMRICRVRIGNEPAHHGDALDQFGDALQEQQAEADHDKRLGRPLRQTAGISRLFVQRQGAQEKGRGGPKHYNRQRQQEERVTDDIDGVADLLGEQIVHDVDADVF